MANPPALNATATDVNPKAIAYVDASSVPVLVSATTPMPVTVTSGATGEIASVARLVSAAGTSGDATNVKASPGVLYGAKGYNAAAAVRYLKFYNSATAPTAGSGTPILTIALPPSTVFALDWTNGLTFSAGIGFTLVTGSADNSSSSVTAADILGLNVEYT